MQLQVVHIPMCIGVVLHQESAWQAKTPEEKKEDISFSKRKRERKEKKRQTRSLHSAAAVVATLAQNRATVMLSSCLVYARCPCSAGLDSHRTKTTNKLIASPSYRESKRQAVGPLTRPSAIYAQIRGVLKDRGNSRPAASCFSVTASALAQQEKRCRNS